MSCLGHPLQDCTRAEGRTSQVGTVNLGTAQCLRGEEQAGCRSKASSVEGIKSQGVVLLNALCTSRQVVKAQAGLTRQFQMSTHCQPPDWGVL